MELAWPTFAFDNWVINPMNAGLLQARKGDPQFADISRAHYCTEEIS